MTWNKMVQACIGRHQGERIVGCVFWYLVRQPHKFLMNAGEPLTALGWLV